MTRVTKNYTLSADIEFEYDPEKVDPFFWINDEGNRQWRMEGIYSDITTEDGIWKHLAYNTLVNGVHDASRLDGWGDLEPGDLMVSVVYGSADIEEE